MSAELSSTLLERLRHDCLDAHGSVLAAVEGLTDEQLRRQAGPHAPSIGFHLWHLARWAEHDVELIEGTPQRWRTEGMAAGWGFPGETGEDETGTELGDEAAASLILPAKDVLMDYARYALGAIDGVVERLTREAEAGKVDPTTVANLFVYVTHDNRHLGMIEALKGVMGISGTATR